METGLPTQTTGGTLFKNLRASMPFYIVALAILAIDQLSKFLVTQHLSIPMAPYPGHPFYRYEIPFYHPDRPWTMALIPGYFALTFVLNTGAAFSSFSGQTLPLALVAAAVAIAIIVYERKLPVRSGWTVASLGLLLGGTLGNFVDRLRLHVVVDMFDLQWMGHNIWPIFNVADMAIDVGVALLILHFLLEGRRQKQEKSSVQSI